MTTDTNNNRMLWFVAGAALGASVAMLYAPASGEEIRRRLAQKTDEGRAALTGSGKDMLDRGREILDRSLQFADEAADMFEKGRQLIDNTAAHLPKE